MGHLDIDNKNVQDDVLFRCDLWIMNFINSKCGSKEGIISLQIGSLDYGSGSYYFLIQLLGKDIIIV